MLANDPGEEQCLELLFRGLSSSDDLQVFSLELVTISRLDQYAATDLFELKFF